MFSYIHSCLAQRPGRRGSVRLLGRCGHRGMHKALNCGHSPEPSMHAIIGPRCDTTATDDNVHMTFQRKRYEVDSRHRSRACDQAWGVFHTYGDAENIPYQECDDQNHIESRGLLGYPKIPTDLWIENVLEEVKSCMSRSNCDHRRQKIE